MKKCIRLLAVALLLLMMYTLLPLSTVTAASTASCPAPTGKNISVMSINVLNNNNKDK